MSTNITVTTFIILFVLYSLTIPLLLYIGFDLKSIISIITPIFVALIALISNQWGIYLNKKYDAKIYTIKKRIEDIDSLSLRLEKCHEEFFNLFSEYSDLMFDNNIVKEILTNNLSTQLLSDVFATVNSISRKIGRLYWGNYSILNDGTKDLFNELHNTVSFEALNEFWSEIISNQTVLQDQSTMDTLTQKYFGSFNQKSTDYLCSIMAYIYHFKEQKDNLLNEL